MQVVRCRCGAIWLRTGEAVEIVECVNGVCDNCAESAGLKLGRRPVEQLEKPIRQCADGGWL